MKLNDMTIADIEQAAAQNAEAAARIGERLFCQNTQSVMNFKSQICTSREQSDRLLALGLKKETADMKYVGLCRNEDGSIFFQKIPICKGVITENNIDLPAWSLHSLIEMMPQSIYHKSLACFLFIDQSRYVQYRHSLYGASQTIMEQFMKSNLWENLINCIEWLIKEGYFNKEYLV